MMPKPAAWIVAALIRIAGKFGKGLPPSHGVGFPGTEKIVGPEELPAPAIARWAPALEQLRDLGFEPLKCEIAQTVGTKLNCSTTLIDELGTTTAVLEWSRMKGAKGMEEVTPLELNSYREDNPDIVTAVVRKTDIAMSEMVNIDSVDMISLENSHPIAQRYQEHLDRCQGKSVKGLTLDEALAFIHDRAEKRFAALLETGIIRELQPKEIECLSEADTTELRSF